VEAERFHWRRNLQPGQTKQVEQMNKVLEVHSSEGAARQYKALLLDFGSVIQKSFFETRKEMEHLLKLPEGTIRWTGPFDPGSDALWQEVISGKFSERDYWGQRAREVGHLVGEEWAIQEFCQKHGELSPAVILRPEVLKLISDTKRAGLKFGILTNELELFHGEGWLETMPFADQVDCIVDATHTHILKPDPRAYELALQGLELAANEVVFIDDQWRNVEGGEKAGIRSLHLDITRHRECIAEARRLLSLAA
jgi:putative hydrolase of the HAD superfamily